MSRFVYIVLIFFSLQGFAKPTLSNRLVKVTGYGQTNVSREGQYPIFVKENGEQIQMSFLSHAVGRQWRNVTSEGRTHLTLVGVRVDGILHVGWVEPYQADSDEKSLGVLKFEADMAWNTIYEKIMENKSWVGRTAPATSSKHEFSYSNGAYPGLVSHLVHPAIDGSREGDLGFLHALIAIGKLAVHGIPPAKIKDYLDAVHQLLELQHPQNYKELVALLTKTPCEPLMSADAKAAASKNVVSKLKRKL